MYSLNQFLIDIEGTFERLHSIVDLTTQLNSNGNVIFDVRDWVNPVRGPATLITDRAILPCIHALLKKTGLYGNNFKSYVTAKIIPTDNINACIEQLRKLEANMQKHSTRLYELGHYDPTSVFRVLAWLLRDLRFYARDISTIMVVIPKFHNHIDNTGRILEKGLLPYLMERSEQGLRKVNQERAEFEAKVLEEDQKASVSQTQPVLYEPSAGFFSRLTSNFLSVVASIGELIGDGLTGTNRFIVRYGLNSKESSLKNLPEEGVRLVHSYVNESHEIINRGLKSAQCRAISRAVDKIAKQAFQLVAQQIIQIVIYLLLYEWYSYSRGPDGDQIEIHDKSYDWLYPLSFSMLTTIVVSQIALRRWLNRRGERDVFDVVPPTIKDDIESKFDEFGKNLGPQLTQKVLNKLDHADLESFLDYLRNNPQS